MSRLKALILVVLFLLLVWFGHEEQITVPHAYIVLSLIAVTLLVELGWESGLLKLPRVETRWVKVGTIGAYLSLSTALVYFTKGVESKYALIYLLPVISGAYTFETAGSVATSLTAVGSYGIFGLMPRPPGTELDEVYELVVNCIFFFIVGAIVNILSMRERAERRKLHEAHEELRHRLHQLETMEEQVHRSERLAALGEMAAGLAHEIRNPLGIIRSATELLDSQTEEENHGRGELARSVIEEVERLNTVVSDFLNFARPLTPKMETVNLTHLVSGVLALIEPEAEQRGVKVVLNQQDESLQYIEGDETMLHRAMLNLCKNALEAMDRGGTLTVELRASDPSGSPSMIVKVHDTGPEIPAEIQSKIFNPFFTTKDEGTGLGLALVHQIIYSHGGSVSFSSEAGKGTSFLVSLPLKE